MSSSRVARLLTIALMVLGALGGALAIFAIVAYAARSIEAAGSSRPDALLVMAEIVLVPIGLALGAAGGAFVARRLVGPWEVMQTPINWPIEVSRDDDAEGAG